jgi:hypothetical protein
MKNFGTSGFVLLMKEHTEKAGQDHFWLFVQEAPLHLDIFDGYCREEIE